MTLLQPPETYWKCPSCGLIDKATVAINQAQMHPCPALRGMSVPLEQIPDPDARTLSRHRAVMAEDYVGDEDPLTAIATDRPDGSNDINVYPHAAKAVVTS